MPHINCKSGRLGASGEDYLEAVYLLSRSGRPARVTGLARKLEVSKPSVVAGLAALERRGLVRHERYGAVELTASGMAAAERVYRRHRVLDEFLVDVLGVSPVVAAGDACAVEHVLSPETVERLVRLLDVCRGPHGAVLRKLMAGGEPGSKGPSPGKPGVGRLGPEPRKGRKPGPGKRAKQSRTAGGPTGRKQVKG